MELIDTHCHLDFDRFDEDRDAVIKRARDDGVSRIIIPGLDLTNSFRIVNLAENYEGLYTAAGMHPNSIGSDPVSLDNAMDRIRSITMHDKVVAVGEIGLDYHWKKTPHAVQHDWLHKQLTLASDLELPVILHNREATEDILRMLNTWVTGELPASLQQRAGVLHSFSGTWEEAQQALEMGFYLGFTGPITYKNADEIRRVAANAPSDRILVETDAPFLTPHPHRGKRNEPANVNYVAEKLAEVRGVSLEEVANVTTQNALRLFRLS